jgi:hypothetical protein
MTRICAEKIGGLDSGRIVSIGTETEIVRRWKPVASQLGHTMTPELCYMRDLVSADLPSLADEFDALAKHLVEQEDRETASEVAALVRSAIADGSTIDIA